MRLIRRLFVTAAAVMLVVLTVAVVLVHLTGVQRLAWSKVVAAVESETGWLVEARTVRLRFFPASLVVDGLTVKTGDARPVSADLVDLRFRWRRLMGMPRSIDRVVIEGLQVDLKNLEIPGREGVPRDPGDVDPFRILEIAELRLTNGRVVAEAGGVEIVLERLSISAALRAGSADIEIDAGTLVLDREGRVLDAGRVTIAVRAGQFGVVVDQFQLDGDDLRLAASGDVTISPSVAGQGTIRAEADVPTLVTWWDPGLGSGLSPGGRLIVDAVIAFDREGGLEIDLEQHGNPVSIAGFSVGGLDVKRGGGVTHASADLVGLGRIEVASEGDGSYRLAADVGEVKVGRLLALVNRPAIASLPAGLRVGGRVEARFAVPVDPTKVAGNGQLLFRWPEGRVELDAAGGGRDWEVRRLQFEVPGATGFGRGVLGGGAITAAARIDVADPAKLAEVASRWVPEIGGLALGGGPISLDLTASGALENPFVEAEADWTGPQIGGVSVDELRAAVSGSMDDLGWTVELRSGPGATASAEGRTAFPQLTTTGTWRVAVDSITDLELPRGLVLQDITGRIAGAGDLRWDGGDWRAAGSVEAVDVGVGTRLIDEARARFELGPDGGSVADARLRMGPARMEVDADLVPLTLQGDLDAAVRVEGLNLGLLGLGDPARGSLRATMAIDGTPSEPVLEGDVYWADDADVAIADPVRMRLTLKGGRFEAVSETWQTVAGPIHAEVDIPLGDLPRPEWFWPGSPTGPIRARLTGIGLRSSPLVEALGLAPLPGEAAGDVNVEVAWDLSDPESRLVLVEIDGLTAKGAHMDLTAQETVRLRLLDNRLEVEPVSLVGPRSRVELGGVYDLGTGRMVGAADLSLDARVIEMLPFPIRATGPIRIQAGVDGPVEAPTATLVVDHEGGSIVMRDPAVEVTDLRLRVEIDDGVVWIQDGEAGLNQGRLWIGGGWDPAIRQGVVLEFEDVKALLGTSIVTSWSGAVAIEPDPDHPARVVGELSLNAGVWERPFDLKEAFFGSDDVAPEEDGPVGDIALDLQVAGYGGIKVDNNLGRFDASWGTLEVGGTVAQPELVGTIRLAPGGTVNLPGQAVTIRRATLDFTGNPDTDPVMEIVPEKYSVGLGGSEGEGGRLDTKLLAAETLARSAGSVLGLENTTLQPAEVAFETQTDASSAFTAGQRLTRNVAIFLTTDLSDVQRQTTMLQLWNLRGLPGLALQGYTRTGEADHGGNLIERYRWGGGAGRDDRPVIQKIKFDGDWPIGKRRLLKATGLRKGEPFEPFLLFAAGLRLEGALAELGYPRARVRGEPEGNPNLPALVFTVDPGPRVAFEFSGDRIPAHVRRAAISLYREPPLEEGSLIEMRQTVTRHLLGDGFPDAEVTVERAEDAVVVTSHRGAKSALNGPVVVGMSDADSASLRRHAGSAAVLAELARDPALAARLVERWLRVEGYSEAKLEEVWVTDGDDGARWVNLRIDPGPRQRLGRVEVVGEDPLGMTANGVPEVEAGMPLDRRAIGQALSRLRSTYRSAGYSDVEISMSLQGGETSDPSMVVTLEPGSQRTVRRVEVAGLRHIHESVILKGLTIEPGQVLLPSDLDTSAVRTAFFAPVEKANVQTRDVGLNLTDVTFEVTEKPRWTVEAGAGWSTERGASLQAGFRDDGLLGRGAGLRLRALWDEKQQQATLYASLPPPPGGSWSMVGNFLWFAGDSRVSPDTFKEEQVGGAVEATYTLTDATSLRGYLRRQRTVAEHKHPEDFPPGFAPDPVTSHETIVGSQIVWDRLDNPFDPRRGSAVAVDLSHNAPNLGSDLNDIRLVLSGSLVTEPKPGWTWAQTLRLGGVEGLGGMIPVANRRFFAGGQATVRGFDLDSIGPVFPAGGGGYKAKGGGALFVLNEEVRIPIVANIRAAVFADVGQVWETWEDATLEFSLGAGFGLRLSTPVGPLWADVAWPVANPNISSSGAKYYFGLGTNF